MQLYLRLLQCLRPYWGRLVAAAICSGLVAAFTGAYAWLVRPALDEVFINRNETWLILLPVVLIVVSVLKGVASYGQTYLMTFVGSRVVTDIRQQLFGHLMRLPISFHLKNPSSRMMSRVINDVNWIQNAVAGVLKDLFQQSLTFLVLLGVVLYQNWWLTSLSFVVIPLSVYPMVRFGARLRRLATTGQERTADVEPRLLLVHLIREVFGLTGTHVGCDTTHCGACTVLLDGLPVKSCTMFGVQADGRSVTTVEGLQTNGQLHPIQAAFKEEHGLQCGFCTSGMMLTGAALLEHNASPSDEEVRWAISGNICRCTGYMNIVKAIQAAGHSMAEEPAGAHA